MLVCTSSIFDIRAAPLLSVTHLPLTTVPFPPEKMPLIVPLGAAGIAISSMLLFTVQGTIFNPGGEMTAGFVLACVFLLLLGFIFLDIEHFHDAPEAQKVAAWVLIGCALTALYVMAHIIYLDAFQFDVLPIGKAPSVYVNQLRVKFRPSGPSSAPLV